MPPSFYVLLPSYYVLRCHAQQWHKYLLLVLPNITVRLAASFILAGVRSSSRPGGILQKDYASFLLQLLPECFLSERGGERGERRESVHRWIVRVCGPQLQYVLGSISKNVEGTLRQTHNSLNRRLQTSSRIHNPHAPYLYYRIHYSAALKRFTSTLPHFKQMSFFIWGLSAAIARVREGKWMRSLSIARRARERKKFLC